MFEDVPIDDCVENFKAEISCSHIKMNEWIVESYTASYITIIWQVGHIDVLHTSSF